MAERLGERRGYGYLLGAAVVFSGMSALVKLGGRSMPVEMLVLARCVVTLAASYAVVRWRGLSPWGNDKKLLVLRGLFGMGGLACFFTAITLLPLADVVVIHHLSPIVTTGLAAWLLRERIGRSLAGALVFGLAGTLLIARPAALFGGYGDPGLHPVGVAAALGGAVFSAFAYIIVRKVSGTDDPDVIVFYFPLVATPVVLPFALHRWVWPSATEWLLLGAIGVVTHIAQMLVTRGLALVPASRATTVGYVQIVLAAAWGVLLFGEPITLWTAAGATAIALAAIILIRRPAEGPSTAPRAV